MFIISCKTITSISISMLVLIGSPTDPVFFDFVVVFLKADSPCFQGEQGLFVLGLAATYSPGCDPSTIGASGLNFSVRDGKRCSPEP